MKLYKSKPMVCVIFKVKMLKSILKGKDCESRKNWKIYS